MALTTTEKLQEGFSLALEQRSAGYNDLVSNADAILHQMKKTGMFTTFSGPTIRERLLYNESGTYVRYSGADFLNPARVELINDAEFEPKLAAVSVSLANEDILKNSGRAQLENIMTVHIDAAEQELTNRFVEDLHSAGALSNQVGGMQKAIPTDPTTGTYGGISRADNSLWRTDAFDIASDFGTITALSSSTAHQIFNSVCIQTTRGKDGPTDIYSARQHYESYTEQLTAIQRINDDNGDGGLGFTSLKFYGPGKSMDVVLEGGRGTAMPDNISYFVDRRTLKFYYHPQRNFAKFGGKQMPINQDMIVQHIGFMGELVLCNPLFNSKLYTT